MRAGAAVADQSPEQEELYALGRDLPHSDLSPAAQPENDRLEPDWERDAACRERDAELVAQRKLHTVDRSGTTHIFRYRPFVRLFVGIILAGAAAGGIAKTAVWLSDGTNSWWTVIGLIAIIGFGLSCIYEGIRMPFAGVRLGGRKMTIRNFSRTYVINASDIRAITLEYRERNGGYWGPKVHLTNGRSIWLQGFYTQVADSRAAPRELVAIVDEIRAALGIRAEATR